MFKEIKDPKADTPTLNRIQQNIAAEFRELETQPRLQVLEVQSSASITSYAVKPEDVYLVINARGGPIKVILPTPARQTQAVKILNAYASNTVKIAQADGAAIGSGGSEINLAAGEAAEMACTGNAWFRFNYAA